MAACTHTFVTTTSDQFMKCSKCAAICNAKYGKPLELVRQKALVRVARSRSAGWFEAEYKMLNQRHSPDYADHEKAERDLRNYWS